LQGEARFQGLESLGIGHNVKLNSESNMGLSNNNILGSLNQIRKIL